MILILHAQLLVMHVQTLLPSKHSQARQNQEVKRQYIVLLLDKSLKRDRESPINGENYYGDWKKIGTTQVRHRIQNDILVDNIIWR